MEQELIQVAQNLVQAQEEKKPVESTDFNVSRAKGALQDKMIGDSTEDEIKAKILLIYSMVGLRPHNYPTGQEKEDLHNYIRLKYSSKTLTELVLAFDLAINNELELKTEDVKVYDQFTITYLASIMAAYKKWLYQQSKTAAQKPIIVAEIEDKKEITYDEMIDWINEWKQKEDIIIQLIPLVFYSFLNQNGLLKITNKEKWEWINRAVISIKTELHGEVSICKTTDALRDFGQFERMEKEGFTGDFKTRIENRAQRLIVNEYLKGRL